MGNTECLRPFPLSEEVDGQCLALIGKIPVILPQELAARLTDVKGQRVGVLRTDNDYRLSVLTPTNHAIDARSNPLSIAQGAPLI